MSGNFRQSWTKVLIHLSKTNAFYWRPSVISKSMFLVDSQLPLSPYSMLQYVPWTLSPGYNIEKGRGGRNVKIRHWKTRSLNETGLFRRVSQLLLAMIVALKMPLQRRPMKMTVGQWRKGSGFLNGLWHHVRNHEILLFQATVILVVVRSFPRQKTKRSWWRNAVIKQVK